MSKTLVSILLFPLTVSAMKDITVSSTYLTVEVGNTMTFKISVNYGLRD